MKIHRFVFNPISVNTWLLADDNDECAVIDCGCYDESEFARLSGFIDDNRLKPVLLLNTHCHLDHIFGNGMFERRYGLKTKACSLEEDNRRDASSHALMFGLEMAPPAAVGEYLDDGQVLTFGNVEVEAIYVPGHSAGSIAYYCRGEGVLFTGDALFAGSIGRTDLPGGNLDRLITGITKRLLTLPDETIVYPGHGETTTIGREKSTNPWLS